MQINCPFQKIILILTICFYTRTFAQHNTISANITGFKNQTKVKLFDQDLQKLVDSSFVINDSFVLKHDISNEVPRSLTLVLIQDSQPTFLRLYIANENIKITGDKKDFRYDMKIVGSSHQNLLNTLNQQLKYLETERTEIVQFWDKEINDSSENYKNKLTLSEIRKQEIDDQTDSIKMKFINENINSYVALHELRYSKYNYPKEDLKNLYDMLDEKLKESPDGNSLLNYMEIGDIVKEGDFYSDFEAQDQYGKTHKLSDYKGTFILLDFTKEFCAPCEAAVTELKKINSRYSDIVKIISFNGEKSKDFWQKGILRNNIDWLCLWDGEGNSGKTIMKYGVQGFPNFFLINREGKIVKYIYGYSKGILQPEIEKLILQ